MWMLNFPFAYDSAVVQARFVSYARALVRAITPAGAAAARARDVRTARARLTSALSADDGRYLEFQQWQEGVARYTEQP